MAKKYIVGIDFGHGETAAWIVPIADGTTIGSDGESLRLKATNTVNDRVLPSVIFRSSDGKYGLQNTPCSNIIGKMKRRVSALRSESALMEAYKAYIHLVVETIVRLNPILTLVGSDDNEPNFYMCMASPTKWSDADKNEYLQFFNEAVADLGVKFEWIINESDAAFFSHKNVVDHDKVTLVIDFGSSTVDYTVMYRGKKVSKDEWSNPQLGAGNIEKAILNSYLAKEYDEFQRVYNGTQALLEETGNQHINIESVLDFEIRKLKEYTYTGGLDEVSFEYHFGDITGLKKEFRGHRFIYDFALSEVTKEYQQDIRHDFEGLKANIKAAIGRDVDCVILSGGACIMNWVLPMVRDVFNGAEIIDDNSPSFVVARGIALYAKSQHDALADLLASVASVDFAAIYRTADMRATKDAIENLSDTVVTKIRSTSRCHQMIDAFSEFILDLDNTNPKYVSFVHSHVKGDVTKKVGEALQQAFVKHFKWKIDTSDISVDVDVECLPWNVSMFSYRVGGRDIEEDSLGLWAGTIMVAIHKILERNSSFYLGTNWTKDRDQHERNLIADSIVGEVLKQADWLDNITYGEDNKFLDLQAASIKEQAMEIAKRIFNEHQLFRTTFA